MATTKVSELSAKTATAGSEELLINDGGTSKKVTIDNVLHDNSIRAEHYVDGSIATAHIADNAITSAKLGVDVIVAEDIANNAITVAELADNAVTTAKILDDNVTADKLANSINTEIAANTAKTTNATHTGEVTGATALTIADNVVDEANLKVSNTPTNGYFLSAQSGNTGGLTWAEVTTTIADGSISTAKIADDAVTADKLANSINTDIATGVTANTTANAALPKTGGTMTGDLILGDNVKLEVGSASGGDLQIYHDGSTSYIYNTEGSLILQDTNGQIYLKPKTGASGVDVLADGAVKLYHDNSKKIETTANGITVTDRVTGSSNLVLASSDSNEKITLNAGGYIDFETDGTVEMRLEADGDLHVDGDVIAFSTTISDEALKYDINPVEFALDKINQLKGVSYKYKHNDRESAGLLAQDVEKVMPSAVKTKKVPLVTGDDKEYKTLHYDSMTAILVEAIKELTAKVKKLESK
jgi:hypothetical protein